MRPPRPVQVLRGAQTHEMILPVLDPVAVVALMEEPEPIEPTRADEETSDPAPSEPEAQSQENRIHRLEADTKRLESVLQQRESMHAEELRRIREETETQVRAEVGSTLQQWTSMVDRLLQQREQLLAEAEKEVMTLSIAMARRILGEAVQVDRDAVLTVVRRSLDMVREQKTIDIHLHPDDLATAKEHENEWLQRAGTRKLSFQADPQLARGDCWIHTESDDVDARIQQQLEAIQEALVVKPT